jgi:hypothetical protein
LLISSLLLENRKKRRRLSAMSHLRYIGGDITGDPKAQAEGKEKQAEAKVRHAVEDVKDEAKKVIE